jgi:hypothetical protein
MPLVAAGGGVLVPDGELTADTLRSTVLPLLRDPDSAGRHGGGRGPAWATGRRHGPGRDGPRGARAGAAVSCERDATDTLGRCTSSASAGPG